jgi:predicted enzyme related to lactoylglutathione lyase
MAKVVGVGGVFLKAKDPKALLKWYGENLDIPVSEYGFASFEGPEAAGTTAFSFFLEAKADGGDQAVVNFRVDSLDAVLERLTAAGVRVDPKREDYGFGKFGWFWDPEENKVELWEPTEDS